MNDKINRAEIWTRLISPQNRRRTWRHQLYKLSRHQITAFQGTKSMVLAVPYQRFLGTKSMLFNTPKIQDFLRHKDNASSVELPKSRAIDGLPAHERTRARAHTDARALDIYPPGTHSAFTSKGSTLAYSTVDVSNDQRLITGMAYWP